MTVEKMSITRALVQLKLLEKKINKSIDVSCFIDYKIGKENNDITCEPEQALDKIMALIKRRDAIKSSIMEANSKVIVKIIDEEMTIMEAIEKKRSIFHLINLKNKMRRQLNDATEHIKYENERVNERLDKQLSEIYGKNGKVREEDYESVSKPFLENNKAILIDPINIQDKIENLSEYIDNFQSEVDLVLSETNSKTEIEIKY